MHTRRWSRPWRRIGCLLLVCAVPAGCADRTDKSRTVPVLRVGVGAGPSARTSGVEVLAEMLYAEPLVGHDWNGRPVGRLADWALNDDGTALTLTLRPGVQFHDRTAVTADVVARFLQKHTAGDRFGLGNVTEVTAAAGERVLVRVSQPDRFLLPALGELKLTHPSSADTGTGPFTLVQRSPVVETRRFDAYHGGVPALGGVRIVTFDTQRSAWSALLRGELDVVQEVSRESVEFMEGNSRIALYPSIQPYYIPLVFNQRHPTLRNVEVRRAISEALDREDIVERAMRRRGRIAEGPIWPLHWAYPDVPKQYQFDRASAAARLDRAGLRLPPAGAAGEFRKRFTFRCLVYNENPEFERIALMIQRQLFDVGIAFEIELVDLRTIGERLARGDFESAVIAFHAGRSLDFTYRAWHSNLGSAAMQDTGYTGADDLLDAYRRSVSDDDARRIVAALADRFHDDAPAAFIAWTEVTRAIDRRFDVRSSPTQDPFFTMAQWRLAGEARQ